jgi:hypothetical protein
MEQSRVDPVDNARLIVLGYLTSEYCKANMHAKSEVVTMSHEITFEEPSFQFNALVEPRYCSFDEGCCAGEPADEGSVLATVLVMVICVLLSVAVVNWFIFGK